MFLSRAIELKGLDLTTYSMGIGLGLCHGKKGQCSKMGTFNAQANQLSKAPGAVGTSASSIPT